MTRLLRRKPVMTVLCLLLLACVVWADVSTPLSLEFHMFYFIPLLLGAWFIGEAFAVLVCVLSAAMVYVDVTAGGLPVTPLVHINVATRLLTLAVVAAAVLALREVNRKLQTSEALRDNLTSMVVHDLKNPLASSAMAVSMLRRSLSESGQRDEDQEEHQELLRIVSESQEELGTLIDELLIIARGESGAEIPLAREPIEIVALLREVVRTAGPRAREGNVELREEYPADGLGLEADGRLLRRVVENLLDNALKFTPPGGRVTIRAVGEAAGVRVEVRDTGEGILPELQKTIFDRFEQAAAVRQGARVSIGLGLTFCRLVITAHGGSLWVESTPGAGAAFIFTLPGRPPQPKAEPNH